MHKRLAQIAEIPVIIQSTLIAVAKTFDGLLEDPICSSSDNLLEVNAINNDIEDPISNDSLEIESEDENSGPRNNNEDQEGADELNSESEIDELVEFTPEPIPEPPEPTEEELAKLEKQKKVLAYVILVRFKIVVDLMCYFSLPD